MTEIRYGDVVNQPGVRHVTGMGSVLGPGGGDGWQIVARLPRTSLPAGTGRLVVMCNGTVGQIQVTGSGTPVNGYLQVCLGQSNGTISPIHQQRLSALEQLGTLDGIAFQFLMVQSASPAIVDAAFGATFDNSTGDEWCIWARTYFAGDPQTYAVEFDIGNVSWVWLDSDRIPAADLLCEVQVGPVNLTTTPAAVYINSNAPGTAGQKWLHFHSLTYIPRNYTIGGLAPSFQFGFIDASAFQPRVGTNGRWGQNRTIRLFGPDSMLCQGGFWYGVQPAGTFFPACDGYDRQQPLGLYTTVLRYAYVGLRLDNLLDVLARTDTEVPAVTTNLASNPPYGAFYVALERPATGIVSSPVLLVHGIVQTTGDQSYDVAVWTNRLRDVDGVDLCSRSNAFLQEGVSCMAFSPRALSASLPDLQYRAIFAGGLAAPNQTLAVRDFCIVQFNMVRDPSGVGAEPPAAASPIILVPGRESAAPGSLSLPPVLPDAAVNEQGQSAMEGIAGATGYKRGWPRWVKHRRPFTLRWSPMKAADADALQAFLHANAAFRYQPPRGDAIAVVQLDPVELQPVSGHLWSLQMRVAELIFTA